MTLVETVETARWATADAATRSALAAEMDHGLREIGFLLVTGHGLPPTTVAEALEALDGFFALPDGDKRRWTPPHPSVNRGYSPLGSEAADPTARAPICARVLLPRRESSRPVRAGDARRHSDSTNAISIPS